MDDPKKGRQRVNRDAGCESDENRVAPQLHARRRFHNTLRTDSYCQKQEASAIHDERLVSADFAKPSVRFHVGGMLRGEFVFFLAVWMRIHLYGGVRSGFQVKGHEVGRLVCLLRGGCLAHRFDA